MPHQDLGPQSIPEQEIEDLAQVTGHQSFLALAKWLRGNREATLAEIRERADHQDKILAELKEGQAAQARELREVKQDGKITKEQAKRTNGRVTDLEMDKRIAEALRKERAETLRKAGEERDRRGEWERLGAGAFLGAFGIGLVTLILHLVGAA